MKHATITEAGFIDHASLRSTAKPRGRPIHKMLVSFSAAYFTGALVTDVVYWQMPDVMWKRFAVWFGAAGLTMAGLAVIAYLLGLLSGRQIDRPGLPRAVGYLLAVLLAL